jgi:hypothetical protein
MSQLHALGIDRNAEAVYRHMLEEPEHGVADLAESLALPVSDIRAALDQLAELRLLRASLQAEGGLRPVSPTVGIQLLLATREKELRHAQLEFADAQAAAMALLQQHAEAGTGRHDVDILTGIEEVQARLEQLAHGATGPLMSFMPGGAQPQATLDAARPLDPALLERGIPMRTLYQASVRNDPSTLSYARWLTSQGAQVRTAAVLPVRMVLFTGQAALLPVDPDNTRRGVVRLVWRGVVRPRVEIHPDGIRVIGFVFRFWLPLQAVRDMDMEQGLSLYTIHGDEVSVFAFSGSMLDWGRTPAAMERIRHALPRRRGIPAKTPQAVRAPDWTLGDLLILPLPIVALLMAAGAFGG